MVLTSDGKKIIGYSKGTNAANSGFIGTGDSGGTIGVLEGTNACEVALNGKRFNTFTFEKPTNAAFNTLVQSHVVYTDRIDPADGPTHPYKCTCFNNSNGTLYTRNTPGNFYISSNISYMVRGNSYANKMNALNIFGPGTLNSVTNVQGAFDNALMFDWNWDTDSCSTITDMFKGCDFNNSNIIFNTINGGIFLSGSTNVNTCRVRQNGGRHLPGMSSVSINVVDFICNVDSGTTRFYAVNANTFNLDANLNNYRPTIAGLIESCQFVSSNISLNFNNSAINVIIFNTKCNANISNATVNGICSRSNGRFNITNSKINSRAFVRCTGAIYANLSNCTLSENVINGSFNNSRLNFNSCNHLKVITDTIVRNIIVSDYNSTTEHVMIYNCSVADTKCYWDNCNAYGFYKVNGSTEQHWENSLVQYSIDLSGSSIHNMFFNNVTFAGNAIRNINNCKVNCDIASNNDSAYYTLLNCHNSVVNLNQTGNAGYPAGYCNNLNLNYHYYGYAYNGTSGAQASGTRPIQYLYNSKIFAVCQLNNCSHQNAFAEGCFNTKIELYDYNINSALYRTIINNSDRINLNYSGAEPGRVFRVSNSVVYGNLLLNNCNNISGTLTTNYLYANVSYVTNSNIVLSPASASTSTSTFGIYNCNNVKINYRLFYNMPPVNFNTCTNMYLVTNSGNSVLFAPNNMRFDLDNVALHKEMIVSNRCVALQAPNIFVQTVTTPGTNADTAQHVLEDDTLIGGSQAMNAEYMAGSYRVILTSSNVRCIGMINSLYFSEQYLSIVNNSVMRVNVTYGLRLTFIGNSYYATNKVNTLGAEAFRIDNCAFIANDTSSWALNTSYVNNSICVLGGQSTRWNTNRNIQFSNCLVIAVKWNRATYSNIQFSNCVLVSSTAFGTLTHNSIRVTSLAQEVVNIKYNTFMPSRFKMPIEGFKMLSGVADAPDSSVISI